MDEIKALYRRWLTELWHGDVSVVHELCAPGFVGHWPDRDVEGLKDTAEQIGRTFAFFYEISTTVNAGPIVEGDTVAAHWTFTGTYMGGVTGATAAPGTKVSFTGTDFLRVADGQFTEYWVVSDALGLMTRLGAIEG